MSAKKKNVTVHLGAPVANALVDHVVRPFMLEVSHLKLDFTFPFIDCYSEPLAGQITSELFLNSSQQLRYEK